MQAPDFELMDQNDTARSLREFRGQWLVLYFYPKDDTPGCTTEACRFRDDIFALRKLGTQVVGVSIDNTDSHRRFADKYGLPFPLLADPKGEIARAYGALWSLGPIRFAKRHTFIIDPKGEIAKIYRNVKPKQHAERVIEDLKRLQQP